MRWFSDAGARSGALALLGLDVSVIGLALIDFNTALGLMLLVGGVVLTVSGLPAVVQRFRAPRQGGTGPAARS